MATFITSDQTTSYSLAGGGAFIVLEDVTMRPTSGRTFSLGSTDVTSVTIAGDAYGGRSIWDALTGTNDITFNVMSTSTVVAEEFGFLGSGDRTLSFNNAGEMIVGDSAFFVYSTTGIANNSGRITTAIDAAYSTFTDGDNTGPAFFSLTNSGTIANLGDTAILEFSDSSVSVLNDGQMVANGLDAVRVLNSALAINNSGSIVGAIQAPGTSTTIIENTGQMIGFINLGDEADTIHNSGTIFGDIFMGGDDDVYYGEQGFLSFGSEIHLGAGDDELDGGMGRERVFDGGGDDDVSTGGGNDSIRAGGGQNNYDGGEGQDYLSYYDFNTRVRIDLAAETTSGGGSGNAASNDTFTSIERVGGTNGGGDTLLGTSEANSMFGFGGEDKLYGRGGNDKLVGGDGDDFFDGGGGTDRLFGGDDNDTFHFDRGEGDDLILDFENNIDTIEFDNFGNFSNAAFLAEYATAGSGNVYFDFGSNGSVMVFDTTIGQLLNDIDIV